MKFYNPFKAHVVQLSTGVYAVRKFSFIGWIYLDSNINDNFWWKMYIKYSFTDTEQQAKDRLAAYTIKPSKPKFTYQ